MISETVVWLPDIKFAGFTPVVPSVGDNIPKSGNEGEFFSQNIGAVFSSVPATSRKPDERLAEDKIGKELAPDATIWELYEEESKDFDDELVNGRNQNLDMMLLFAGLFSAVVMGFLVETTSLLQQDPAEVSQMLLLQIAQSQQRLEQGITQPTSPIIEIPSFEAPSSARWINGLWFLSLALSLCAALVAMLAKEWLTAFTASRPRAPYDHAITHQQRLQGLGGWYALHMIDLLPTLLHFSLLLFSIGLVIYLWTLDYAIALAILVIVGATTLFYVGTAIFGAFYRFCPFVTQISKYIQNTFVAHRAHTKLSDDKAPRPHTTAATSLVLQSLKWLSENARDPVVGDCSYQALAGIRTLLAPAKDSDSPDNGPSPFGNSTYSRLLRNQCALDHAWSNDRPYFTADTHVLLTAAELRLTAIAASNHDSEHPESDLIPPSPSCDHRENSSKDEIAVSIIEEETSTSKNSLFELRARCSRALFRAAVQLKYHADGSIHIRTDALVSLLESIRLTFLRPSLCPDTPMSTHQPQSETSNALPRFMSSVVGTGIDRYLYPLEIGDEDGLLTGIMRLICDGNTVESPELVNAARDTLSAVAPVLLGQWLRMHLGLSGDEAQRLRIESALEYLSTHWPKRPLASRDFPLALDVWTHRQLLAIAFTAAQCFDCHGIGPLLENTLRTLHQLASLGSLGQSCASNAATGSYYLIIGLIEIMCANSHAPDSLSLKYLVQWLLTTNVVNGHTVIQDAREDNTFTSDDDDIYLTFLKIWAWAPGLDAELKYFIDMILTGPIDDAIEVLWGSSGLSALADIGRHSAYAPILGELIAHITTRFLGEDRGEDHWKDPSRRVALPHFLQLVGPTLNTLPSSNLSTEQPILSGAFIYAASSVQCYLQAELFYQGLGSYDSTFFEMIRDVLLNGVSASSERDELLSEYEELLRISNDSEAWMYGALSWLFGPDNIPIEKNYESLREVIN